MAYRYMCFWVGFREKKNSLLTVILKLLYVFIGVNIVIFVKLDVSVVLFYIKTANMRDTFWWVGVGWGGVGGNIFLTQLVLHYVVYGAKFTLMNTYKNFKIRTVFFSRNPTNKKISRHVGKFVYNFKLYTP